MKKVILLSGIAKNEYFNKNISDALKRIEKQPQKLVVIPTNPDDYLKNDNYFNGTNEIKGVVNCFKKIYPSLNCFLLDNRINKKEGINELISADIIYLLGGNPFTQLDYLRKNNYDEVIKQTNALVMGVSAGAMNLAVNAYYSKDEDLENSLFYKGLGLVDITIDPHFDITNEEQIAEVKKYSQAQKIIGLPNNSAIIINEGKTQYLGPKYIYENGKLQK